MQKTNRKPPLVLLITLLLTVMMTNVSLALTAGKIGQDQIWETEYYLIEGQTAGPVIVVIAGIHGDETAGWRAAERLIAGNIDRGKIIILPRANIQAVREKRREYLGGQDLNRCFPGDFSGTAMERLAYAIFNLIKDNQAVVLIDLHESMAFHQEHKEYLGQTIIAYQNKSSIWTAMKVIEEVNQGISSKKEGFYLLHCPVQGSLNWAAGEFINITSLTIETCMQHELVERINYQLEIVKRILAECGVNLECN